MSEKKIVCVPDQHHAEFMCPVDKKIPRFLIKGRKGMSSKNHKIPISKLTKKGLDVATLVIASMFLKLYFEFLFFLHLIKNE